MKRKSLPINPKQNIRVHRKNKTQKFDTIQHKLNWYRLKKCLSQIVSEWMIDQLLVKMKEQIDVIAEQEFYNLLVNDVYQGCSNLQMALSPSQHLYQQNILDPQKQKQAISRQNLIKRYDTIWKSQDEPQRVCYDPICGFDKLITRKNQLSCTALAKTNHKRNDSVNSHKSNLMNGYQQKNYRKQIKNQQNVQISAESNVNPILSTSKKPKQNKISGFKTILDSSDLKNIRQQHKINCYNHQKLVPLQFIGEVVAAGAKQTQKHESYFREKLFENLPNLPLLMHQCLKPVSKNNLLSCKNIDYSKNTSKLMNKQNSIISSFNIKGSHNNVSHNSHAHSTTNEDGVYDYNGDALPLHQNRQLLSNLNLTTRNHKTLNNRNNILKTTYKIMDAIKLSNLEGSIIENSFMSNNNQKQTQRQQNVKTDDFKLKSKKNKRMSVDTSRMMIQKINSCQKQNSDCGVLILPNSINSRTSQIPSANGKDNNNKLHKISKLKNSIDVSCAVVADNVVNEKDVARIAKSFDSILYTNYNSKNSDLKLSSILQAKFRQTKIQYKQKQYKAEIINSGQQNNSNMVHRSHKQSVIKKGIQPSREMVQNTQIDRKRSRVV